jgi:TRAP transporter TAXI family solute receptor
MKAIASGRKQSFLRLSVLCSLIIGASFFFNPIAADAVDNKPISISLGGGSPSGIWSALGEGIGEAVRREYPGSNYTYEPGNEATNIQRVSKGEIPLGLMNNPTLRMLKEKIPPYDQINPNFYALAGVYDNWPQQWVIRKDFAEKNGIKSLADVAKKKLPIKLAVNQHGMFYEKICETALEAYGFNYADIKSWGGDIVYQSFGKSLRLLKDRRLEINQTVGPFPISRYNETNLTMPLMMFNMDKAVKKMQEVWNMPPFTMPKGTYAWAPFDVQTNTAIGLLIVGKSVSDDMAYKIAKSLVNQIKVIRNVHKSFEKIKPTLFINTAGVQIHPGAEKFYREAGLIK